MEKIKLAVFDMDGLIFDSEREFMNELKAVMSEYGYTLTEEIYKSTIGLTGKMLIEKMYSNYGENYPFKEISRKARERVSQTALSGNMKIKPGIKELLEFLNEKNIVCTVASSSSEKYVSQYLEVSGLRKYFSSITGGDEVECSKPEPDIFLKACEKEGFTEKTAVVLEDSPNGVTAAFRAGIFVICIPDLVTPSKELISSAGVMVKDAYEAKNIIKMLI